MSTACIFLHPHYEGIPIPVFIHAQRCVPTAKGDYSGLTPHGAMLTGSISEGDDLSGCQSVSPGQLIVGSLAGWNTFWMARVAAKKLVDAG